jgi:hypothetical protein
MIASVLFLIWALEILLRLLFTRKRKTMLIDQGSAQFEAGISVNIVTLPPAS